MTPLGLGWPNIVSALRLFLAPVVVVLVLREGELAGWTAGIVFVAGAMTDLLDGYLARRHASETRTGQWLDPLADKLFVVAPVVAMTGTGRFPWWAAATIVLRELTISLLRVFVGLRGRGMPASQPAKVKTILQVLAITLYILPLGAGAARLRLAVLLLALAFTVYTAVDYIVHAYAGGVDGHRSDEGVSSR